MIKKILLYCGIQETFLFTLLQANYHKEFAENGILHVGTEYLQNNIALCNKYFFPSTFSTADIHETLVGLKEINTDSFPQKEGVLVIGCSLFKPQKRYLQNLFAACKKLFPDAEQHFFLYTPICDDLLLETVSASQFVFSGNAAPAYALQERATIWPKNFQYYEDIQYIVRHIGKDRLHVGDGELLAMLLAKHMNQTSLSRALINMRPPKIPHDVLLFCAAANLTGQWPPQYETIVKWSAIVEELIADHISEDKKQSILQTELHNEFITLCAQENKKVGAVIGKRLPLLYNLDGNPYCHANILSDEKISFFLSKLCYESKQYIKSQYNLTKKEYLSREQRIIAECLHVYCNDAPMPPARKNKSLPTVSVLTCTYNHKEFIQKNIESVLAQKTSFPVQHIIADDASTDSTQKIILDLARKYKSIIPVFQRNRTFGSKNIHHLFNMARTEFVSLCDGDDYFTDVHKIQNQYDYLKNNTNCSICFHPVRVEYDDKKTPSHTFPLLTELPGGKKKFYTLEDLLQKNFIQTNSVMYRWRFKNGLPSWFRSDLCPGDWYWHILHAEIGDIGYIDDVMSVYYRHKNGVYYNSYKDRLKHRALVGEKELEMYSAVNKHFHRKYEEKLFNFTNGIFFECCQYEKTERTERKEEGILEKLCDRYPDFAMHFIKTQRLAN